MPAAAGRRCGAASVASPAGFLLRFGAQPGTTPMPSAFLLAILLATPALADSVEDGRALAERWCATCHAVDDRQGADAAPPFAVLAKQREDAALAGWMAAPPHGVMPDPGLSRDQLDALLAYIRSLR